MNRNSSASAIVSTVLAIAGCIVPQRLVANAGGANANDALYVFLAITGKPTDAELVDRVQSFADAGVDGFTIYARDGLEYEYMGEEWLHVNEVLCREAEKKGLKVFLYDEFAWPSGRANGQVGRENAAFRYCEDAVFQQADGSLHWEHFLGEEESANVLETAAMTRFIELTHEKYQQRLGRWCRNGVITGIFTDEPGHPYDIKYDKKPIAKVRSWSTLSNDYFMATGRDFRRDVETWIRSGGKSDDITAKVWETYAELHGRQFRMAYCDQIAAKAREMGIESTGHMIAEESVLSTCFLNGNLLAVASGLTLPGIDDIVCRTRYRSVYTYSIGQYVARKRGNGAIIELFALGPADTTAAKIRQYFWISALFGISKYLCSMDSLDMKGLYKRNAYLAPFGAYQPWWKGGARVLADEARRAAKYALNPKFHNEIAIRYPQSLSARNAHCAKHDGRWSYSGTFTPKISQLTSRLQLAQLSTLIAAEHDDPDEKYVFSFTADNRILEERSRTVYDSPEKIVDRLIAENGQPLHLEEKDGTWANDLLLRNYDDGMSVAVNMSPSTAPRELFAVTKLGRMPVTLPHRGILELERGKITSSGGKQTAATATEKRHDLDPPYALKLDRANYKRIAFTSNRVARIVLDQPMTGIRFALLDEAASQSAVTLDGIPLRAENPADEMPRNYSVIYKSTGKMSLSAGEHRFQLSDGFEDGNYFLPLVVMIGEFSDKHDRIGDLPGSCHGEDLATLGLDGFTGAASYCMDALIPDANGALFLSLNSNDAFTEVLVDGESLGIRAWAPFEWEIPAKFKGGKHELQIKVVTNITAMWGDLHAKDTIYAARPERFWWGIPPRTMGQKKGLTGKPHFHPAP
ncbi:MAG: hypothetical protein ACI4Q3_10700, partial [Kiritimatiellia bacterium]